jgi:hypothetical protein
MSFELAFYLSFVDPSEPEIPADDALHGAMSLDEFQPEERQSQFQAKGDDGVIDIINWWGDGLDARYEQN